MPSLSFLQPWMIWIKVLAIAAVLAGAAYGGYSYGQATAHNEDNAKYSKLETEYSAAKVQWSNTLATADAQALAKLEEVQKENDAKEAAKQKAIDALTVAYQTTQKELKNAKQAAIDNVEHPHASADPSTDGLWVDADSATCTFNKDGLDLVSEAAKGGLQSGSIRCRLSVSTSTRLIESAAQAGELNNKYNLCVKSLNEAVKIETPTEDKPAEEAKP